MPELRPSPAGLKIGGYNLCYLRPEATLGTVTLDEYKAPVTASWQAGMGRVVCYTGEADGKYAGAIKNWDRVGDYYTSLARWTAAGSVSRSRAACRTSCRAIMSADPAAAASPRAKRRVKRSVR